MNNKPLYNSRIIDTYLKLLDERYPAVNRWEILRHAGMEDYEVADQGHWFFQEQIDLFYEKCVQLTGNKNIARDAGRFAAAPGTLGAMRQYVLGLAGPLKAFSIIGISTKKFTRSSEYSSRKINGTKVEVVAAPLPGVAEKIFQCENRIGFFEAIVQSFNIDIPQIEHPECVFKGDNACRYVISWRRNRAANVRRGRDATILVGVLTTLLTLVIDPLTALKMILPASAVGSLIMAWLTERIRVGELEKGLDHLWGTSDQLSEQIELNYRNTRMAADVGDVIATRTSISEVIESVVSVLQEALDYDRGMILLANEDASQLEIRGAYGYIDQHLDIITNISFSLDKPDSRGMLVISYRDQKPFLINNIEDVESDLSKKSTEFVKALGIQSFICVPIVLEGKSIGILAVDNIKSKKPLLVSDVNQLTGITPVIAVSIQNARLLEARAAQFDSTLQVMADSIDARDFLTAGHSEQVAEYAVGIAEELGLEEKYCQVVRMASLLHDYGKIAIPDSILKKTGPLTIEEREVIRTHPAKTRQILDKVAFEGPFKKIPFICHAHHERWDGTGYPNALQGEDIPLEARIIAAADFFEAITAKRHYREPIKMEKALQMFQEESGKYFQPEIVDAFIRYLEHNSVCLLDDNGLSAAHPWRTPRQQRIPYRTEVSVRVGHKIITGTIVDISHGGLYISSDEVGKLNPAAEIQLTFNLPGRDKLIQLPGKVTWINQGGSPSRNLPRGFGVQFQEVSSETKMVMQNYIESYLSYSHQLTNITAS